MNIFGIGKQKETKKIPILKKVTELTAEERAEIEDQAKAGIPAREIADGLNLNVETIYNYRRILNNQAKDAGNNTTKDILAQKLQDREILKADYELEKLRMDLEQKKQTMEMERLQFQKTLSEWKTEINGTESDDEFNIKDLLGLFSGAISANNKTQSTTNAVTTQQQPAPVSSSLPDPVANDPENDQTPPLIEVSDEEIRRMISGFEKKDLKLAKLVPDKILFDKIAEKFPTVSDQSIDRAIQIFRSEY